MNAAFTVYKPQFNIVKLWQHIVHIRDCTLKSSMYISQHTLLAVCI